MHWVSIGQLGTFLKILEDNKITQAVMAGQVKHVKIFGGFMPDMTAMSLMGKLKGFNTDALIGAVADLMRERGVELVNSAKFLEPLLAGEGQLSDRAPNEAERKDLEFGYRMADTIAGLDIGQTIAVKHQAVVAVEAMEGTDETIARAGHLAGDGVSIIKVAKPNQDMRFDVPIVGLATIQAMRLAGAKVLVDRRGPHADLRSRSLPQVRERGEHCDRGAARPTRPWRRREEMRAAVIGVGHLGQHHARILASLPGVSLAGVVDINKERASKIAGEFGTAAFGDVREMSGLDVAVIASPTESHAAIALPLLASGVHTLIEKPLSQDAGRSRCADRGGKDIRRGARGRS